MNTPARQQTTANKLQHVSPRDLVKQRADTLIKTLPGKESAQKRFMQAAVAVCSSPNVARCSPESVFKAVYQCARLNLIPDPVLHHAAIVPFRNNKTQTSEATLIIEYRGLIELMKRANPALTIKADTVYEHDDYELLEGSVEELKITKRWWAKGKKDPGKAILFYCVVKEPGADPVLQFVPAIEAVRIGESSKAGMRKGTPWHDHFERMGEKTAIKRIERFVRMDPDKEETRQFREALEHDERSEQNHVVDDLDVLGDIGSSDPNPAAELDEGRSRIGSGARKPVNTHVSSPPPAADIDKSDAKASAADKKKLGAIVDLKLDEFGSTTSTSNRKKLLEIVTGHEDIDGLMKVATTGEVASWRDAVKSLTKDQYDQGPEATEGG